MSKKYIVSMLIFVPCIQCMHTLEIRKKELVANICLARQNTKNMIAKSLQSFKECEGLLKERNNEISAEDKKNLLNFITKNITCIEKELQDDKTFSNNFNNFSKEDLKTYNTHTKFIQEALKTFKAFKMPK